MTKVIHYCSVEKTQDSFIKKKRKKRTETVDYKEVCLINYIEMRIFNWIVGYVCNLVLIIVNSMPIDDQAVCILRNNLKK